MFKKYLHVESKSSQREEDGGRGDRRARRADDTNAAILDRLTELERLTIRADELTNRGATKSAINAWGEVALLAEPLLGRADASVIDAMRIIASLMGRLEMQGDALRVLENAAERLVDAGWHRSDRGRAIADQMRAMQRSGRTTVLADSDFRSGRIGRPASRTA